MEFVGYAFYAVLAILIGAMIAMMLRRKRWYVVHTATPERLILSRKVLEWEVSGTLVFRDENDRKVIIPKRWILKIVEIRNGEIEIARKEVEESNIVSAN